MNDQEYYKLRTNALLSAQGALLGAISPKTLGIYIKINSSAVQLVVFVDGALSSEETEALEIACTEMIADLYPPTIVTLKIIENAKEPLQESGILVFLLYGVKTTPSET